MDLMKRGAFPISQLIMNNTLNLEDSIQWRILEGGATVAPLKLIDCVIF